MNAESNIFAELTPPGRGGISTLALRSPRAADILSEIFRPGPAHVGRLLDNRHNKTEKVLPYLPSAGIICYGHILDESGRAIDEVLLRRTAPDEFEIHCHGGPASVSRLAARLQAAGLTRCLWTDYVAASSSSNSPAAGWHGHAKRGHEEKTLEQEVVSSSPLSISAEASFLVPRLATLRAALFVLDQTSRLPAALREIETLPPSAARDQLSRLLAAYESSGRWFEQPPRLAILGPPNVGKSSLLNALVGHDRAIVTPVPGTTRDVVTELAALDGLPVLFADTAGLRDTADRIEQLGVERARAAALDCDLLLYVVDLSSPEKHAECATAGLVPPCESPMITFGSKADLAPAAPLPPGLDLATSALTGQGLDQLAALILSRLGFRWPAPGEAVPFTRRQADALRQTLAAL